MILEVDNNNFETEVKEHNTIVFFWSDTCAPCKTIKPMLDEISDEYGDELRIAKCDASKNLPIAGKCQVFAVPTLIFFRESVGTSRLIGSFSKSDVIARIQELFNLMPV